MLDSRLFGETDHPFLVHTAAMKDELVADFRITSTRVSAAAAFVMLIWSSFSALAKVYDSDGSEASVWALLKAAHDGDTITLPAGTFSWTSPLLITKGITLQGATTISGAGTSAPVVNDNTIILDDIPRVANGTIIRVQITPAQTPRITGITFRYGAITTSGTACLTLNAVGATPGKMRVDHCHFDQLYEGWLMWVTGWNNGVADNNVMHVRGRSFPFQIRHDQYGGSSQTLGNGAWADYPWYGTDKFWFIETNTIIRIAATAPPAALVDGDHGARWVIRHNYIENCLLQGHGTEGGPVRSQRANEVYNNVFNITLPHNANGGARGGTLLRHDNVHLGYEPAAAGSLANYRLGWTRNDPVWGISDGTSVWDRNDTEGNGTYVEGHPPFLFDSGTATSPNVATANQSTFTDSTKNWTPDQWAGYSIRNTNPAVNLGTYIISNTSNTITYWWGSTSGGRQMTFSVGDTYEIHRVLTVMDGCGMGKGDQVGAGRQPPPAPASPPPTGKGHRVKGSRQPINTTVGRPFWTHEATEPCYSWNNVYLPNGHVLGFRGSGLAVLPPRENIEYFNLGGGFAADTTPSQVRSRYVAALNGVDYTGTFVYPHPLVTGEPTPVPGAIPRSQQHLQKKKQKRRKGGQKKSRMTWLQWTLVIAGGVEAIPPLPRLY
jgi:hypothetical protein